MGYTDTSVPQLTTADAVRDITVNDVVSVIDDPELNVKLYGLLGYVSGVDGDEITVTFFHSVKDDEPAHAKTETFTRSQLYFVGPCNPALLPPA